MLGRIKLHIRMGEAGGRVVFCALRSLEVPVILQTSNIDRFVKAIFPPDRKIVLYSSKLVPSLAGKNMLQDQ